MKTLLGSLLIVLFITTGNLYAEDITNVEAKNADISKNLDLEAVASVFGEAKDLEDFEKKLNDPKTQISNLDLNEDGEVDYLRVTETSKGDTHLVTIQAVIGKDQYQDVATIDVEKKGGDETQVQVVGDVYMYGPSYIIEPVYVHPPVIYLFFWGAVYRPWRSPYYWGFYPPYYRPWRPYSRHRYQTNIDIHINNNNSYNRTTIRKSTTANTLQRQERRNDFERKNPGKSLNTQNKGIKNNRDLGQRADKPRATKKVSDTKVSTGKKVQKDWKPSSERIKSSREVRNSGKTLSTERKQSRPQKATSKSRMKSSSGNTRQQIGRPSPSRSRNHAGRGRRQ